MLESRKKEIRIKANEFRSDCRIIAYGILDLFEECVRRGYKLIRYPLDENGILGFTQKREGDVIIVTNSSSRLSREIFTLAHEIGHVLLHMEKQDSYMEDIGTIDDISGSKKEQEANWFAAYLLMPDDVVNKYFDLEIAEENQKKLSAYDIAGIMTSFGVSFEMTLNRLMELGKIDSQGKARLDNDRNMLRVGNLLKSISGNSRLNEASNEMRLPGEYLDWVIFNFNHGAIPQKTLEKALGYFYLTIEDIRDRIQMKEEEEFDLDSLIGGMDD